MKPDPLSRRNLTDAQRVMVMGRAHESRKKTFAEAGAQKGKSQPQSEAGFGKEAATIAKERGVSRATVERAAQVAKVVDADPLDQLISEMERTGEIVTLPDGTKRAMKPNSCQNGPHRPVIVPALCPHPDGQDAPDGLK